MFEALFLSLAARAAVLAVDAHGLQGNPDAQEQRAQDASPAALIERAAYAEEHERDFARALELYQQALEVATRTGDLARAQEASGSISRVQARMGAVAGEADDADPIEERVGRLMHLTQAAQGSTQAVQAISDLPLFGARAVPLLKAAVANRVRVGTYDILPNTDIFVQVLARMPDQEALAALDELSRAPDPLTRRAVARSLERADQIELLRRLAEDPVEEVRSAAVQSLARSSSDPSLEPLMARAMARGDRNATRWLQSVRPASIAKVLSDEATSPDARLTAISSLQLNDYGYDTAVLDVLLSIARTGDAAERDRALNLLAQLTEKNWQPLTRDVARRIEEELTPLLDQHGGEALLGLLISVGGPRSLSQVVPHVVAELGTLTDGEFSMLLRRLRNHLSRYGAPEFVSLAGSLAQVPTTEDDPQYERRNQLFGTLYDRLRSLAKEQGVSAKHLVDALGAVSSRHREWVLGVAVNWLNQTYDPNTFRPAGEEPELLDPVILPVLRELARSSKMSHRAAAALGLGATRDSAQIADLIALMGDSDAKVTQEAGRAVSQFIHREPERSAQALRAALNADLTTTGELRVDLVRQFDRFPSPLALELFKEFWSKATREAERAELIGVLLEELPDPAATALLLERYPEIPRFSNYWRGEALNWFGEALYEPAIPLIGEALRDPDPELRAMAQSAFSAFQQHRKVLDEFDQWIAADAQSKQTIAELVALLADPRPEIQLGAIQALGNLKARSAAPALVKLLETPNEDVRRAIHEALEKLGQ